MKVAIGSVWSDEESFAVQSLRRMMGMPVPRGKIIPRVMIFMEETYRVQRKLKSSWVSAVPEKYHPNLQA